MSEILAFCHIPKTAGTSANQMLRRHFGATLMSARTRIGAGTTYRYEDLAKDIKIYPNLRCITGHPMKPFVDFHEFGARLKWFTFLRDPVQRLVSHYVHQQTNQMHQYKMGFHQWADKFDRANLQVQWIAGEQDVEAAKQIIEEKFAFVGFVEHFSESLRQFAISFGLKEFCIQSSKRRMVARDTSLRDKILGELDSYQETLDANTALDQQLIEFIRKRNQECQPANHHPIERSENLAPSAFQSAIFQVRLTQFRLKDKFTYARFVKQDSKQ
jgi:hypothetical protein